MIKRLIPYYGIPLLLLLVASAQLLMVRHGLNRWRGGGFGMYSEFHYSKTVLLIKTGEEQSIRQDSVMLADSIPGRLLQNAKIFPSEYHVKKLARTVASKLHHRNFIIEVWKPALQMDSLLYRRNLVLRYHHENETFDR